VSKNKSVDSEWKSRSAKQTHRRSCYSGDGDFECCCSLRESVDLYNQSIAEVGLADWPEET
jgi:hypothetical protein